MLIYIYIHFVCLFCPLETGRELDMKQDFQKSSRVSKESFAYVQIAGYSEGRYIYIVLTVDINWRLL